MPLSRSEPPLSRWTRSVWALAAGCNPLAAPRLPPSLQIPRISRAQVFDALSSMSSIAGYRAVVEACGVYGRLLMGQITAAGRVQPSKVGAKAHPRRCCQCVTPHCIACRSS